MSADRPYQSRLLSFLNRQVQVAKDRTGIVWRTVKLGLSTALTIGIQGILYPFYAVLKAAELVGKQLGEAQEKAQFWLRSGLGNPEAAPETLTSDSPLQNLLTALTQRQLAPTPVGDADELTMVLAAEMAIQGVASRISDRRLVLVTPTQQVLDVLSDSQALAIQKRISYEVALYLRWVRSRTIGPTQSKLLKFFNPLALQGKSERLKSELPKSELQASPVRIPTLWQDPANLTNLGFFSLPNLQDLPSLQELPSLIEAAFKYFLGRSGLGLTEAVPYTVRYQPSLVIETQLNLIAAQPIQISPPKKITLKRTQISAPVKPLPRSKSSDLIENFDCNPLFTPDWLETEFEHLGYDRTWLDHCVAWLDEILVRVEKTFLTIWASFLRLFQSR
jgi:hypothetical protein